MQDYQQIRCQIALPLLPEVGLVTAKELIRFFGSAADVFEASEEAWKSIPNITRKRISTIRGGFADALERADKEVSFIKKHDIRTWYFQDADYPCRLAQCADAPILLYGKGNININDGHFVSVVGTRAPSDRGKELCRNLVMQLAEQVEDLTIVSGLAYGIDITAHRAALEAGVPTLIIPGHGLDRVYPAVHRQVAVEALTNGGIVTEYISGTEPDKQNFVARNRIIAGLADAVVVVESKAKGGSLITANMAVDYGRDLFAFPGRPNDERSAGCNLLLKMQKAALIESADDLIAAMMWESKTQKVIAPRLFDDFTPEEQKVADVVRQYEDGIHVNQVVMEVQMPYYQVTTLLFQLEMKGVVRALPGGMYRPL